MKKLLGGIAGSVILAVLLCFGATQSTQAAATTQSVAFPMYEYPTIGTLWADVNAAGSEVPFLIVNPASGPGVSVDPTYTSYISGNTAAGQRSIGYVHSDYQVRPLTEVLSDIDDWYQMYPEITGIFVDLIQNGSAADLCYAATVHNYVKTTHPTHLLVQNPGANIEARYEPYADIFMNAENFYSNYTSWAPLTDGFENNPAFADRFWHIVHTATSGQRAAAQALTRTNNAGWVLVTDETMPNPYMAVPSYWSAFLADVASLPQTPIPNRGLTALPAGCLDLSMNTASQNSSGSKQVSTTAASTITNTDSSRTSWPATKLTYTVPSGATLSSLDAGSGWTCSTSSLECNYTSAIAAGASPPTVTATIIAGCNYQSGTATVTLKNFANNTGTAPISLVKPSDCSVSSGGTSSGGSGTAKKAKASGGSAAAETPAPASEEPVTTTVTTAPEKEVSNAFPPAQKPVQKKEAATTTGMDITPFVIGGIAVLLGLIIVGFWLWRRGRNRNMPI